MLGEALVELEGEPDSEEVALTLDEGLQEGDGLGVVVAVHVTVGVKEFVGDAVEAMLGLWVTVLVDVIERVTVGEADVVGDAVTVGVTVGVTVWVGVADGDVMGGPRP
jgi:hypothetical protein